MKLHNFVADPTPVLPLLEALKDDGEEYVRRSVANNLNDIAKDHPALVADTAERWLVGAGRNRERLVRHACRTLIKQGDEAALKALGYKAIDGLQAKLRIETPVVEYGTALKFSADFWGGEANAPAMVDFAIHFMKANGETSPKVFKWKDTKLDGAGALSAEKKHAIKPITTRVYYPGVHWLEIFVNGRPVAKEAFELRME